MEGKGERLCRQRPAHCPVPWLRGFPLPQSLACGMGMRVLSRSPGPSEAPETEWVKEFCELARIMLLEKGKVFPPHQKTVQKYIHI